MAIFATAYNLDRPALYGFLFALIVFAIGRIFLKPPRLRIPRIGRAPNGPFGLAKARADFLIHGRQLAEDGYSKYSQSMFVVQTADMERVILSARYAEELRTYPTDVLSSVDAQCERHLASWNTLDVVRRSSLHVDVTRVQLSRHLGRMAGDLQDEVEHALSSELGACTTGSEDYYYVTAHTMILKVVSRTVNRALVGLPLCRDDRWFETSMGYMADAFAISGALRPRPHVVRYFVYPFLEARLRIRKHLAVANRLLAPVIKQRVPKDTTHKDVLQWMIDDAQGRDRDPQELTHKTLFLCLASMSSSTMGIVHALYDLCAMPEIIEPLREEIRVALSEEGGWTLAMSQRLKKLDSFLKESQRINHPGLFSFNRKVLKPIHLSDGTVLPAGTFISMPTYSIARDPSFYDSPNKFQPFRFYDLRQRNPEEANRHQLTSTGPTNLAFGYGQAACPGRAFAAVEMKMILGHLVYLYDFKFPMGQIERPENVFMDERIWPSRAQQVGFRLRADTRNSL